MDVTGANRDVVLRVKIEQDPSNAATLARMAAEVDAAKKVMGRPVSIGVRGGSGPIKYDPNDPLSMFEGEKWLPDIRKGLAANAARGGAATAGAGVAGVGAVGLASAGTAALAGVGAAAYSAYDTFWGNKTLAQSGIGRVGGGWLQSGWQGLANVGNFFTTSGDYFDPLGTARAGKLEKREADMMRARRDSEIYTSRDQQIGQVRREGALSLRNRNADAGNFAQMTNLDRSMYENMQAQRLANIYGGNQEGLVRAQLDMIGNRSALSRAPEMSRIQNTITSLQGNSNRSADEEQQLADVLERQRRLKMEITQETIKSLEAARRERVERAQAIREEGMSQQERFGNLSTAEQSRIINADKRLRAGRANVEDRRLLADFGGDETKKLLRDQAIANAGNFPFAAEFANNANRQEAIAKQIEVKLQEAQQIEIKVSMENDVAGDLLAKRIVEATRQYVDKRIAEIGKKAQKAVDAGQR